MRDTLLDDEEDLRSCPAGKEAQVQADEDPNRFLQNVDGRGTAVSNAR